MNDETRIHFHELMANIVGDDNAARIRNQMDAAGLKIVRADRYQAMLSILNEEKNYYENTDSPMLKRIEDALS